MHIKILTTGGTIDKTYQKYSGEFDFGKSCVNEIISQWDVSNVEFSICEVLKKDSLFMDDYDRKKIAFACYTASESHIVVTHGTDTMVETAEIIASSLIKSKTIVLTGAMTPYSMRTTDAPQNLAAACTAVQLLPFGVYINMNGTTYPYNNVYKDRENCVFKPKCKRHFEDWGYNLKNQNLNIKTL